jgi:hypothetical protein
MKNNMKKNQTTKKNVYISYEKRAGKVSLLMQLRIRSDEMPLIEALDTKEKEIQKGYRYSRNRAIINAIKSYTRNQVK